MTIDWYPGHMLTAKKDVAAIMGKMDVVIEVLDARAPFASCNPIVETLRKKHAKPALKIFNKSDIADAVITEGWLAYYNALPATRAIALSSKKPAQTQRVPKECEALAASAPGRTKPLQLLILGIPNVGKSTLMNALLQKHVAKVGDEPAITKHQMRHQLKNGMTLVDTPGMLWPGIAQGPAFLLAAANSIGKNAYDDREVATGLAALLLHHYRPLLEKRYGAIPAECVGHGLLACIAQRRALVKKGGLPDLDKAAAMLLQDFRTGTLGPISLERASELL